MQWTCKFCKMYTGSDRALYRSHFTFVCDLGCVSGSAKAHSRECHHLYTHPHRRSCACPFELIISICILMIYFVAQTCVCSGVRGKGCCMCVVRSIMQHHSQRILMTEFLAQTCLCSGMRGMESVCVLSVPSGSTIVCAL